MVSVLLSIIDDIMPAGESGPVVLKISSIMPVAAEDENILMIATGIISEGISKGAASGVNIPAIKSRKLELLIMETAKRRATRVGRISMTSLKPSFTPLIKQEYTSVLCITPYMII